MQLPLSFATSKPGRSRKTDPETSVSASRSINARALENQVAAYLLYVHPEDRTTKELAQEMNLPRISVSPRMICLERQGRAKRVGRRDKCETWKAVK